MELSHTQFGAFELYTIETGQFRLDGGAMFGVVPKTLWSRAIEADRKNRIPMAMRCLLIKSNATDKLYLIDNGIGDKMSDKMQEIYQIDTGQSSLLSSLEYHGFAPEKITDLIFTHLHFDHCGGTTFYDKSGKLQHRFPQARYHITKKHMKTATAPNARETASFLADNIEPLVESDRLHLVDDHHEYEPGLTGVPVDGHTLGQQLIKIQHGEEAILYAADLIPTHAHVPLPWVMGYDMYPVQTLEEKEKFLDETIKNHWWLYLQHDADTEMIQLHKKNRKYQVKATATLDNF